METGGYWAACGAEAKCWLGKLVNRQIKPIGDDR